MYARILPSQLLDITNVLENGKSKFFNMNRESNQNYAISAPSRCENCHSLAFYDCQHCGVYCKRCMRFKHMDYGCWNHEAEPLINPPGFETSSDFDEVPRIFFQLSAVISIKASHYVAFVKTGHGLNSPWVYFNSMADYSGGVCIPSMVPVPDITTWLSEEGGRQLNDAHTIEQLPEFAESFFCDANYMIYHPVSSNESQV